MTRNGDTDRLVEILDLAYGIEDAVLECLPLGADPGSILYRVDGRDDSHYLLKLRRGQFDATNIAVPRWVAAAGLAEIIPPLAALDGRSLSVQVPPYTAVLYPFVDARVGWDVDLTGKQWVRVGRAVRFLHSAPIPDDLLNPVRRETYDSRWRRRIPHLLRCAPAWRDHADAAIAGLGRLLIDRVGVIRWLTSRAAAHAESFTRKNLELTLCHGDLHAGNILIAEDGRLYIVDWDTLVLAPKERDLMFIGGGVGGRWNRPDEVERFTAGYGAATIDHAALAYYRCERIVEDIVVTSGEILESGVHESDRLVALRQLLSQFEPGNVVEIAMATAWRAAELSAR